MNAELEGLLDQLTAIRQDAPGLINNLTVNQCWWRPSPSRWSIGDCFEHLNATAQASVPVLDEAIRRGRSAGLTSAGPFTYALYERALVKSMEPPPRVRFRARKNFLPPGTQTPPAALFSAFIAWQDRFAVLIEAADGLDLRRVRQPSPVISVLRYSLGTGFAILLAHERRHLWQARVMRNDTGFPEL